MSDSGPTSRASGDGLALELDNVSKSFGALHAVDGVSFRVAVGERRAVIGPNGAGKTTVFNLISGELSVSSGSVALFGRDITRMPPYRRVALRLGRTYQITNVFLGLSVEENLLLAAQGLAGSKFDLFSPLPSKGEVRDRVSEALDATELAAKASLVARELSYGEQRQLELGLALATKPRVLMLDEPAAGLSAAERVHIGELVRGLPKTLTIVLIEHDMDLALGLVDSVTCLHFGRVIAEGEPEEIRKNPTVQEVYLGAD